MDPLAELRSLRFDIAPARKRELLAILARRRLPDADAVHALHEALCFLRAYPDGPEVLAAAERLLAGFGARADLRRRRAALADTGIAGTALDFRFFWLMAIRLVERWPEALSIVWEDFEHREKLVDLLHLLLPFGESPSLDAFDLSSRDWLETLRGPEETDAAFLIRRFEALAVPTPLREKLYEDLDVPIRLAPGPETPARGREKWPRAPVVFRARPPEQGRPPDLKRAVRALRPRVRAASRREARELIDLANACMVTRHRDLLVFLYADERDVRIVDFGDGLQFACFGAVPDRRLVLEAVYGFLTLRNGVPTGYVLCSAFFGSAEIAYNVFETFRGADTAQTFAAVLAMVRALFGVDTFALDPYQLGHDNEEGQESGAWWFYYKLGFRPHDAGVKKLVREELRRMKRNPRHRTPARRLHELAAEYMFLHFGRPRRDVLGRLALGDIGLHVNRQLALRGGADREAAVADCAAEAAKLLLLRGKLPPGERLAWERWAPLALALPGVRRWGPKDRRALRDVIRAKGGRRESDYVRLFDRHRKLRAALLRLAETEPD